MRFLVGLILSISFICVAHADYEENRRRVLEVFGGKGELECTPPSQSSWHGSDRYLVLNTKRIVVARLESIWKAASRDDTYKKDFRVQYGYSDHWTRHKHTFKVEKVVKGSLLPTRFQVISMVGNKAVSLNGLSCEMVFGLTIGKTYLIFEDAYHPKAIVEITGDNDPWLKRVEELVKEREK